MQVYPALLQEKLDADGFGYEVVNAGVSGDTSAGRVRRVDWALKGSVKVVILELGPNDILRGQPVEAMKANLSDIIEKAKKHGATVLLAGREAPTNSGVEYRRGVQRSLSVFGARTERSADSVLSGQRSGNRISESTRQDSSE